MDKRHLGRLPVLPNYSLLDSGEGEKLERFGSQVLRRPSSLCIWRRKRPELWEKADAIYDPAGKSWSLARKGQPREWKFDNELFSFELRLQSNGQVGIFPEHFGYLHLMIEELGRKGESAKVLNLFAYTGMATVIAARQGAEACHIDNSDRALEWARKNASLNQIEQGKTRFINEDALKFLRREIKRGNRYDIVIADPPSFSRVDKNNTWDVEEVALELVDSCIEVMNPQSAALFISSHHAALSPEILANLISDCGKRQFRAIEADSLSLTDENRRTLPAGGYIYASY